MNLFLLGLASLNLLTCLIVGYRLSRGGRSLAHLTGVPPKEPPLPSVSVIVPARNEERHIATALESLLHLDYEPLDIVVVNDRSTDRTGEILDAMASKHPRMRVVHVHELPPGWLGKNHALYLGAQQSNSDWLLFTDADVVMEPSTLRRAIQYAVTHQVDHLPMLFRVIMPNWWLESFVLTFSLFFFAYFEPWKARDPRSRAHVGIGGFNLIRSEAYRAIGTHQAIALRPDDDVKLGKIVKKHGFRQDLVIATEFMYVPWYSSLGELIRGLEKNAFSGVDYRIWVVVASSIVAFTFDVFPFIAVFITHGLTRWLYLLVVALLLLTCVGAASGAKLRRSCAFGFPFAVLLFIFIQYRTMLLNLWHRGIYWRDTHYPLHELKANRV